MYRFDNYAANLVFLAAFCTLMHSAGRVLLDQFRLSIRLSVRVP